MKLENKFLSYFWNNFDFLIRFIYCRNAFFKKILFWKLYFSDFRKLDQKFEEMKKNTLKNRFDFEGKICLEIGPGNSYINAYNFLMNKAKKVILIDKFPRMVKSREQHKYFIQEIDYIKKKYAKENLFFFKDGKLDERYIKFISGDITNINLLEKFDFIYSFSVLEHIKKSQSLKFQLFLIFLDPLAII